MTGTWDMAPAPVANRVSSSREYSWRHVTLKMIRTAVDTQLRDLERLLEHAGHRPDHVDVATVQTSVDEIPSDDALQRRFRISASVSVVG